MSEEKKDFPPNIARLLDDQDIHGLTVALRQAGDAALRASAAKALAELGDTSATEMLVRSFLEDPESSVCASARRALTQLVGGQAEMAIAVYQAANRNPLQAGTVEEDAWLRIGNQEHDPEEATEFQTEELSTADLEGINRIAMYEGSEKLRFLAIRALSQSSDMRATDTLANLALWGDNRRLRAAARQALEDRYGEQAETILDSYRIDAFEEATSSDQQDALEDDLFPEDEDDEYDDDVGDEDDQEDQEDDTQDVDNEDEPTSHLRSPYATVETGRSGSPIIEETGDGWRIILIAVIGLAFLAAVLILGRF